MVTILRPLSTSELLDRTFHLYRNNFVVFAAIVAIPQLALLALQLLFSATVLGNTSTAMGLIALPLGIVGFLCIEISHAATVFAVSNLHLDRPVRVGAAFRGISASIPRVIGIAFVVSLIVGFGFVLLLVPGIYWALKYALAIPVTVLEGTGLQSLSRSSDLTKGNRGRIFVVYFLLVVLNFVVSTSIQFVFGLGLPFARHHPPGAFTAARFALTAVSGFVTSSLVGPLLTIALTLIYYDERVRKEGFDLQVMMATLETGTQKTAVAPAS
jgi:Membrane domain of glycerophosphoryl diester phosphodiesterase